ncbi:MAG: hypothetical protein KGZ42_13860 [Melioribacter sp.]|nr:hypothetical protein [Melioribacter sp.]
MFDRTKISKEVEKFISDSINNGIPKSEIFSQVKSQHPEYVEEDIAKKISSFINEDVKKSNAIHSYILSALVIVSIFFAFTNSYTFAPQRLQIFYMVWKIIIGIIALFFIIGFLRFKLFYYTTAVSLYTFYLILVIYNLIAYSISLLLIVWSIGIVLTLIYLILIPKRLFPNVNFGGNVIKENGNYKF